VLILFFTFKFGASLTRIVLNSDLVPYSDLTAYISICGYSVMHDIGHKQKCRLNMSHMPLHSAALAYPPTPNATPEMVSHIQRINAY
jgi:hypothetical protein